MARGGAGAFGGKTINRAWLWLVFCALFLAGLADLRRPLSLRNLDLLALLSFSISLRFFNEGEIFWSAPLAYPPLVYLLGRCVWIARRDRPPRASRPVWPVWVLAARGDLPRRLPGRAQRRGAAERDRRRLRRRGRGAADRERPDAVRPHAGRGRPRSRAARPTPRARSASGSRRTAAARRSNPRGRHVRPGLVPRLPARLRRLRLDAGSGTSSGPRTRPRSSSTRSASSGSRSSGCRFGGPRLAATLAFAWAAYPFTHYVVELEHERRDHAGVPDLGLLARVVRVGARRGRRARGLDEVRGAAARAALALVSERAARRPARRFALGFAGGDARRLLGAAARARPAARRPRLRRADVRLSSSTASRRSRSGAGGSTTPPACPTCTLVQQVLRGARRRRARCSSRSCRGGSRSSSSPR